MNPKVGKEISVKRKSHFPLLTQFFQNETEKGLHKLTTLTIPSQDNTFSLMQTITLFYLLYKELLGLLIPIQLHKFKEVVEQSGLSSIDLIILLFTHNLRNERFSSVTLNRERDPYPTFAKEPGRQLPLLYRETNRDTNRNIDVDPLRLKISISNEDADIESITEKDKMISRLEDVFY
jgi:hypothetical protein